ncbi:MAG: dTDP-4-dehydrorhamnose 3,5-epimerase family protein, partial [Gemmatimonadales bacterium]
MRVAPTGIEGVVVVTPTLVRDERGFFARTFSDATFAEHGLARQFPQSSISFNANAGTLRGLHLQIAEHAEDKLVRCTSGAVFDVAVDLRAGSPTRLSWVGVELTAQNRSAVYIPKGCAHGFVSLEPNTELLYLISTPHQPSAARGLR